MQPDILKDVSTPLLIQFKSAGFKTTSKNTETFFKISFFILIGERNVYNVGLE